MSASSTISNLQSALNCAGKCDCCDKLQSQIDEQNKRLRDLEKKQKQCCDNKDKDKDNNNDLEKRIKKIENYIESLEVGLDIIVTVLTSIKEIIKKFFK